MRTRPTLVLLRPLAGVLDSVNRVIPIPLLAICRNLDRERYRVAIVDQRMPRWREDLDRALERDVLLVGITCLTGYQIHFGTQLARYVRRRAPRAPIVWGGVHPTATPEETLREPFVDYVVIGEGEVTFPALVDALAGGGDPAALPGVGSKGPGGAIRVNPRPPLLDISELDDLPYDLIDMREYVDGLEDAPFYGVEGSRGCIYACTFCYNPGYNQRQWRPRGAVRIVDNLERLHRAHGIRNFFVSDDCFFVSLDRAREFAELMIERDLGIRWGCEANLSILSKMDDATLQKLADSGLDFLSIGVESGSERVIEYVAKPVRLSDLRTFNRRLARYPIHPKYTFMTGTPIEGERELRQSVDLVRQLMADNDKALIQAFYLATPYPGTVYLEQCREHGFVPPTRLADWANFDPFSVARYLPWIRGRKKRMFEFMMYGSLFIDDKATYHTGSSAIGRLTAAVGRLYRPVARFRFQHLLHTPFPEGAAIKAVNTAQRILASKRI